VRTLLSGAEHDELRVMRLSGGVSGVGWVTGWGKERSGAKTLGRFFLGIRGRGGGMRSASRSIDRRRNGNDMLLSGDGG